MGTAKFLMGDTEDEVGAIQQGLFNMVPQGILQSHQITSQDMKMMLGGCDRIDVQDWKSASDYPEGQVSQWFFEVLEEFDGERRAQMLNFVTGRLTVPSLGFNWLEPPFTIHATCRCRESTAVHKCPHLPQAHTCFHYLDLPLYNSKELLRTKLLMALSGTRGFQIR